MSGQNCKCPHCRSNSIHLEQRNLVKSESSLELLEIVPKSSETLEVLSLKRVGSVDHGTISQPPVSALSAETVKTWYMFGFNKFKSRKTSHVAGAPLLKARTSDASLVLGRYSMSPRPSVASLCWSVTNECMVTPDTVAKYT